MSAPTSQPATTPPVESERPLRELMKIAAPSIATMTSYTLMQFVDTLMVSRIEPPDPVYVAAAGNGGVWVWTPMAICVGVTGMVNTFVSQHLGAGRPRETPAYAWNALWFSALFALLLLPYAVYFPQFLTWQATLFARPGAPAPDPRMIELASVYGRVLIAGAFITLANKVFSQYFYGLHRPRVVFLAALAGNVTNLGLNYLFIYGRPEIGIPAMGVQGAAIATVIGTGVELLIPLALFLSPRLHAELGTRTAWRLDLRKIKDLLRTGWAPALMHGNEMVCWAIFMSALVGSFGTLHNSASWIVLRYMHTSFMPAVGISFAITAVVGKAIGAGRHDIAQQRAWLGVKVAMIYMTACALAMAIFREPLVGLFLPKGTSPADAAEIVRIGSGIMIVAACFQLFDAMGISLIGALRGAGDTVVPGVVTMVLAWTLIIGLGMLIVHVAPGLGAVGPWIAAAVYISVFGLWAAHRWWRGRWKSIKLIDHARHA
jgi:MATE family multidrug resistance protein